LPIDKEIDLDDPDGISQEDIDIMNRQADELEEMAEGAERNAEKIEKAKKAMEGMSFAQLNALNSTGLGEVGESGTGGGVSKGELYDIIIEILAEQEEAKKEREDNKKKITENEQAILDAKADIKQARAQVGQAQGVVGEINSFRASPVGAGKSKIMGMLGKFGVYGILAQFAIQMAEQTFNQVMTEIKAQFKAGGVFDTRKMVQDQLLEYNTISYLTKLRSGQVFFTADAGQDLRQGAPRGTNNTRDLRDGHLRFIQFHAGI